jgi:DNA-binding response OmpR family regulator
MQEEQPDMNTSRILVVDDDPSILKFVWANLEARGYKVFLAVDGEEAMRIAESGKPDLIILDIVMPGINGLAVCRKIRERSSVPILMLSAREGENDKEKCEEYGANDYLTKPFVLRDLLSRVKTLLKNE